MQGTIMDEQYDFDYSYMPRSRYMLFFSLQVSSASLSMMGSITIIYLILKQRAIRFEVYHRLLLALSFADIVFDTSIILQFLAVRADTGHPLAMGNIQTCTAVGFFTTFGFSAVNLYFVVLSVYFLLTIRYRKSERQLKALVEPYGHVFAIGLPLSICVTALFLEAFNPVRIFPTCFMRPYPSNCLWDDEIPCQRGGGALKLFTVMMFFAFSTLITGILCTWLVFWTVRQQQRRNMRHSFGEVAEASHQKRIRQVARQACWYTLVFFNGLIASTFSSRSESIFSAGLGRPQDTTGEELADNTVIAVLSAIYMFACPLQGVLNLIIYVWPGYNSWRHLGHSRRVSLQRAVSGQALSITDQTRQYVDGNINEHSRLSRGDTSRTAFEPSNQFVATRASDRRPIENDVQDSSTDPGLQLEPIGEVEETLPVTANVSQTLDYNTGLENHESTREVNRHERKSSEVAEGEQDNHLPVETDSTASPPPSISRNIPKTSRESTA